MMGPPVNAACSVLQVVPHGAVYLAILHADRECQLSVLERDTKCEMGITLALIFLFLFQHMRMEEMP